MIQATRKHEMKHYDEWKSAYAADWPALKRGIEALSVPATADGVDVPREEATSDLRQSLEFYNLTRTSNESGNFPTFWVPHDDAAMGAVEHTVVDPRINELCTHAKAQGWNVGLNLDASSTGCRICTSHGVS